MSAIDDLAELLIRQRGMDDAYCGLAHCGNTRASFIGMPPYPVLFKRNIPPIQDDVVAIIDGGGGTSDKALASTDRSLVTVLSQSADVEASRRNLQDVRNIILSDVPFVGKDGKLVYRAEVLSEGKYERKEKTGPLFVQTTTFRVSKQSMSYEPKAETIAGKDLTDIMAKFIEKITGQRCYRGQMPPADGLAYSIVQTGGSSDEREAEQMDTPSFEVRTRSCDILEAEQMAKEIHESIHMARHIGPIVDIDASPPRYVREGQAGAMHNYYITVTSTIRRA